MYINELPEWQALIKHKQSIELQSMQTWFAQNPNRFQDFSLHTNGILIDYSKNRITHETLELLFNLASAINLNEKIAALFSGKPVNFTEKRPALHTALRKPISQSLFINGKNIVPEIHAVHQQMREFTEKVRNHTLLGATKQPFKDIINIGIGGSHLGPLMATHALANYATESLRCHFISDVDGEHLQQTLRKLNPETSLFIISSKSFTTLETLTNASAIRNWLQKKLGTQEVQKHFVAITAAKDKAMDFGIDEPAIFPLWDWVGGRYSVWSAIGLPLALMIGMDHFFEFLAGGYAMDQHLLQSEFKQNTPVILALLGIWYINFFGTQSHAIVPYTHKLNFLRAHLQQLEMESNGKRTGKTGTFLEYATSSIIWGENGCNGQHAFHQLLHQGQYLIPIDFILTADAEAEFKDHQSILVASGLSQAQALMRGKTFEEALDELCSEGYSRTEAEELAIHKSVPGNRPSTILFLDKLTPFNLGSLLALYEHKTFLQGAIWNINSFDQWGVELGKKILPSILKDIQGNAIESNHDASTLGLVAHFKKIKQVIS